jgi:hypothetical protein
MKPVGLLILSDTHLEFAQFQPLPPDTFDIAVYVRPWSTARLNGVRR